MIIEVYTAHGGARYWRRMLDEWRGTGHEVREVCAFDDATYRRARGRLGRLWLRLRTYVFYPLRVWTRLQVGDTFPGVLRVVITSPFFLPYIVAVSVRSRESPIVIIINDLFPDALVCAGFLRRNGVPARLLGAMTRTCFRRCDAAVFLGSHLKAYAEHAYGHVPMARIIPVGADAAFVASSLPDSIAGLSSLGILYSGSMGHMHETDTILEAIRRGLPSGVSFTFHSSGVGYAKLRRDLCREPSSANRVVELLDPLEDSEWRAALRRYPVGLVTLKAGAEEISMPSKTYSALAAGQAVLALCSHESDLAALVRKHACGWVIAPGDIDGLLSLLAHLAASPGEVNVKRRAAFEAGHSQYDMAAVSEQYIELFRELMTTACARPSSLMR